MLINNNYITLVQYIITVQRLTTLLVMSNKTDKTSKMVEIRLAVELQSINDCLGN